MKTKELFSLVSTLSGVTRFSMLKMVHRENVLEHTGMMACFAVTLGMRLNQIPGHAFDIALLLSKSIVHDWDEVVTGDVARPTKYFSKTLRNEMDALERQGVNDIGAALGLPLLASLHERAKDEAEGQLVGLCDIACAVHRCWEEVLVFNNMQFTLPAPRLRKVLHQKVKALQLGQMSSEQWKIVDKFALDLNNILNDVVKAGNGHLTEIAHAENP